MVEEHLTWPSLPFIVHIPFGSQLFELVNFCRIILECIPKYPNRSKVVSSRNSAKKIVEILGALEIQPQRIKAVGVSICIKIHLRRSNIPYKAIIGSERM